MTLIFRAEFATACIARTLVALSLARPGNRTDQRAIGTMLRRSVGTQPGMAGLRARKAAGSTQRQ